MLKWQERKSKTHGNKGAFILSRLDVDADENKGPTLVLELCHSQMDVGTRDLHDLRSRQFRFHNAA